jgi:hypothetical protein
MKKFTLCFSTVFLFLFLSTSNAQNHALNFDGVNDRIIVPNISQYDFEYGTVEVWVRPQGLTGNACIIANRSFGGTRWSFHMSTSQIGLYNGYSFGAVNFNSTAGEWYHLAFVCYPYETEIFVNGNSIGYTNNVIMGWEYNNWEYEGITGQELSIGSVRDGGGTYEHFKGDIDDIRIWDYTRSQQQINDNKNITLSGSETGLVSLFNFNQGVSGGNNIGLTSAVESATLNHGFLVNFALSGISSNFLARFSTLPVALTDFKASKQNSSVLLQWNTATEQNSHSFAIERSTDGNNFTAIGSVRAAGNSNSKKLYRYEDISPLRGNNYYRLKLIDADGKSAYSDVRLISFSVDTKLTWYTQGRNAVVQLPGGANEQYVVSDMNGVTSAQGRLENGRLLISGKPAGVYNVRVWTGTGVRMIKVVIQ